MFNNNFDIEEESLLEDLKNLKIQNEDNLEENKEILKFENREKTNYKITELSN